jgi:hypothetical protein
VTPWHLAASRNRYRARAMGRSRTGTQRSSRAEGEVRFETTNRNHTVRGPRPAHDTVGRSEHSENGSGTEESQRLGVLRSDLGTKLDFVRRRLRNEHERKNSDSKTQSARTTTQATPENQDGSEHNRTKIDQI